MKFECGDLERALANPELMADAKEHLRDCAVCRSEYRMWHEISNVAKQLHCEWDSPELWPNIRKAIEAERPAPKNWWIGWKLWTLSAAAATVMMFAVARWPLMTAPPAPDKGVQLTSVSGQDFLTEQALREVEKNESAYRHSIEELSRLAQLKFESRTASPLLVSYREKLLMLDSAIQETRSNIAQNRFNVSLQTELSDLYREKQDTLREVLTNGQQN